MVDTTPLVSVVAACYNQAKFVLESLESIRNQTYSNIELIVFDDCSTDNSVEVIEKWIIDKNVDCLFLKHEKNIGLSNSLNDALSYVNGKYLQVIALDDILLANKIEKQVNLFETLDDSYAIVYGAMTTIKEDGSVIDQAIFHPHFRDTSYYPSDNIFEKVVQNFFFYNQAALIKMNALRNSQFKFDGRFISEDWFLQLLLSRKYKIQGMSDVVVKYRIVSNSTTNQHWTNDRMYKISFSHFRMFSFLLDLEKRDTSRWILIRNRMREYLFRMYNSEKKSLKNIVYAVSVLWIKSRHKSDVMFLRKMLTK